MTEALPSSVGVHAIPVANARRVARGRWAAVAAGSVVLAALGGVALKALPYSTSWVQRVDELTVAGPPGTRVGSLVWDLELYRSAPGLRAFRDVFGPACTGNQGVDAARCVTAILADRSPVGDPVGEFVDRDFEPAKALASHLAGAPGHCTARSSMVATALLSMGVPARVVQLLVPGGGHNAIEVWDQNAGWVLFDPLYDSSYLENGQPTTATSLSRASSGFTWRRPHEGAPDPNHFAGATIHYPEPWLYTRVGAKCARWPFRACFAQIGPERWYLGPLQRLCLFGGLLAGLVAVLALLRLAALRPHLT